MTKEKFEPEEFQELLVETARSLDEYIDDRLEDGDVSEGYAEGWKLGIDQLVLELCGRKSEEDVLLEELKISTD